MAETVGFEDHQYSLSYENMLAHIIGEWEVAKEDILELYELRDSLQYLLDELQTTLEKKQADHIQRATALYAAPGRLPSRQEILEVFGATIRHRPRHPTIDLPNARIWPDTSLAEVRKSDPEIAHLIAIIEAVCDDLDAVVENVQKIILEDKEGQQLIKAVLFAAEARKLERSVVNTVNAAKACISQAKLYCDPWFRLNHYADRLKMPEYLTDEHLRSLVSYLASRAEPNRPGPFRVLELGARDGRLAYYIQAYAASLADPSTFTYIATDVAPILSERYSPVLERDYAAALSEFQPDVVIVSWMPFFDDFTASIRRTPSVREYILIGDPDASGHPWRTWGNPRYGGKHDTVLLRNLRAECKTLAQRVAVTLTEKDLKATVGHGEVSLRRNQRRTDVDLSNAVVRYQSGVPVTPYELDGFRREILPMSKLQLGKLQPAEGSTANATGTFSFRRTK